MSGLYEVISWLIYALAAVMLLTVTVTAILAGLALRFVAEFLQELGNGKRAAPRKVGKSETHRRR